MAQGDVTCNLTKAIPKRCAVFDGVDDSVEISNMKFNYNDVMTNWTISVWIKPNLDNAPDVWGGSGIIYMSAGSDPRLWISQRGSNFKIRYSNGIDCDLTNPFDIPKGEWTHITGILKKSGTSTAQLLIYMNGVYTDTSTDTTATHVNIPDGILRIGQFTNFFNGSIADVQIFNKALSQEEITKVYQGLNVTDGLVSRWKLDYDYKDSVGSNDGTNSGSYLSAVDDQVSQAISDARVTANDKYMMCMVNKKVMTAVIEEA